MKRHLMTSGFTVFLVLASMGCPPDATAQIHSVTLGIRTHCPYGIRGCWPEIRDGLEATSEIESIIGEPDVKTDTCEVKMRGDWTADPAMFQRNFTSMRIGVDVRGVEIVAEGILELQEKKLVLRINEKDEPVELAALIQKVQWDRERKQAQGATQSEKQAFTKLKKLFQRKPVRVRVVGPLVFAEKEEPGKRILQVRKFDLLEADPKKG
jgi:hypothetical protein